MSNRNSYLSTAKQYRNLERQIALGSKPGAFRRLFGGAKAKVQSLANTVYARKKLAPINYKLSIAWKQHVMGLLKKQQNAQQKVETLKLTWKRGMNPVNFKSKLNNAQRNLEEAKRRVKNARKQKVLTLGSTEYTKKGVTPVVSAVPVVKRSNLNNNIQRLVNIARKNPPKLNKVLNDEFNRLFPFRPENKWVKMREKLYGYASMKGVPWSVQKAATRRAIKSGRAATNYNQQQAFKKAEEKRKKAEVIGRMKEALNKKARENAAKKVKKNYTPSLNTIRENNNLNSHPLVKNPLYNSNSNINANNSNNNYSSAKGNNNSNNEFHEPGIFPINANVAKANEQAQIARILANQNAKQKAKTAAAAAKANLAATKARLVANNAKLARMVQNASSAAARAEAIAKLKGPQPKGILKKAYPLPLIENKNNAYALPLIENAANVANNAASSAVAVTRANLLRGVAAPQPKRVNLLREVAVPQQRSSGLLQVAGQPKKTLRERAANLRRSRNAKRNAKRREASLGALPIFPRHNFGGRAIV